MIGVVARRRRLRGGPADVGLPRDRPARRPGRARCCTCWCATATDEALLGVVPWTDSIDRLGELRPTAGHDINRYAAPIGVSPGIELITVAGVGLIALAVDTLAVTCRRAALAGLPLLVLYTVPTAVAPEGVNWVAFAVGRRSAFLTLLLAESRERVSRWGRPMRYTADRRELPARGRDHAAEPGRPAGRGDRARPGARRTRRAAGPVGRLVRLRQRRLRQWRRRATRSRWSTRSSSCGENLRRGENTAGHPVRRRRADVPAAGRRSTSSPATCGSPASSRCPATTTTSRTACPAARASTRRSTTSNRAATEIEIFDLAQTWLPLPYPATKVDDIDGDLAATTRRRSTSSARTARRSELEYQVRALSVRPTPEQLRRRARHPRSVAARTCELPRRLLRRGQASSREQDDRGLATTATTGARAAGLVARPATSSPTPTLDSDGDRRHRRAGDPRLPATTGAATACSSPSTMAVMARMLGIPARVAVGFTSGSADGDGVCQVVGLNDAHAWPELYFQGAGWVRVRADPGRRRRPPRRRGPGVVPDGDDAQRRPEPGRDAPAPTRPPASAASENRPTRGHQPEGLNPATGGIGAGPVRVPVAAVRHRRGPAAAARRPERDAAAGPRAGAGATPTLPTAAALAAWADLQDTLVDHGVRLGPQRPAAARRGPPRRGAAPGRRAGRGAAPGGGGDRAGPLRPGDDPRSATCAPTSTRCAAALSDGSSRWGRWRARLLPRSTSAVAAAASERLADGLDAIDAAVECGHHAGCGCAAPDAAEPPRPCPTAPVHRCRHR